MAVEVTIPAEEAILKHNRVLQLGILFILLLCLIVVSTGMGYVEIPFVRVVETVLDWFSGGEYKGNSVDVMTATIIMDVRLPRILTAAVVGGGLGVSGALFQGILLNPLADPYTLGVSAGAAFGACIAILLNLAANACSVPLFAFMGAASTLIFVIYLSMGGGESGHRSLSSNNLILSGIIVAAILSAGISFLKYVADEQVSIIIFWLMGSFTSKTWMDVGLTFLAVTAGFLISLFFARDLNLIALGPRSAATLGVDTRRVTMVLLITATMVTAVCVSVSGIIGFVGLLVPHMVRLVTGPDNRKLLPVSLLVGAILLLFADTVTRAVLPGEIPIGVLTALIGGPVFCYIFRKSHLERTGGGRG